MSTESQTPEPQEPESYDDLKALIRKLSKAQFEMLSRICVGDDSRVFGRTVEALTGKALVKRTTEPFRGLPGGIYRYSACFDSLGDLADALGIGLTDEECQQLREDLLEESDGE